MIGSETLFKKIMEKLHLLLFNSNNCKYNCRGGFIAENEIFVSYYKLFIKGIKIVLNLRVQVTLSKKEYKMTKLKPKKIIDVYDREMTINESNQKLHAFNNEKNEIIYTAQIIENGELTQFWTDYKENGTIDSIEQKMNFWGNPLKAHYATMVDYDSTKNDPDKRLWKEIIKFVEENQEKYFDEFGDWKEKIVAIPDLRVISLESYKGWFDKEYNTK